VMARMRRVRKPKTLEKRIAYKLISKDSAPGKKMYPMLEELVGKHHEELSNAKARISLAWALNWKADVDGRKKLGACKKASDLDRELAAWDFVILVSQAFFEDADITDEQRMALLDHELMHATVRLDKNGEPVVDERGRTVFRLRKHDLEEFADVVRRHGMWKRDLEVFGAALAHGKGAKQLSLLDKYGDKPRGPQPVSAPKPPAGH
jgi:Putative phage metallopeptidase